jgi:hypothetical protein
MSHIILPRTVAHTVVPSTPLLEQCVDAVVLGERTPFGTEGKSVTLEQFRDATGLDDVQLEIVKMVCIRTTFLFIY